MFRFATILSLVLSCTILYAQKVTPEMTDIAHDLYEAVNEGRQQEADILADKYLTLCSDYKFRYGSFYAEALHVKAHTAAARSDFRMALQIMDEVIEARLDKRSSSCNYDRLGLSYFDRSTYNFRQQNTDQAINDLQAAADAYQKAKENGKYATALCQMAVYCKYRGAPGDLKREIECYEKAFPAVERYTPEYLSVATMMVSAYNDQGKSTKASKLVSQMKKTAEKISRNEPIRYANFLLSASVAKTNSEQYEQALSYTDEAISIYEAANHVADHNYAVLLKNAADCHFHLQHYQEALSLYERAKPLLLETEGEGGKVYMGCLQQLITTNARLGKSNQAQRYSHQQQEQIYSTVSDTTTLSFANTLTTQAHMQAELGNYEEAVSWGERALRRYEARGDSLQQALILYMLSNYYTHLGQQQLADSLSALSLQISHRRGYSQTEADVLNQQAMSLYKVGRYDEADKVFRQALLLLRESNLSVSTAYASVLCNRALCQDKLGNIKKAVSLTQEALNLQTGIIGQEHGDNIVLLYNLAMYYHRLEQMDSVAYYYHRAITQQTQQVRNNFSFQSTKQRELFWQGKSYLYQTAPLFATTPDDAPSELLSDIYDAQLFTKGILLNSEINFRRLLQKKADKKVLEQYDELQMLRAELQQCYEAKAGEDKQGDIVGLKHRIEQLNFAIMQQCKEYGDFTQNLSLTSDSVRRALRSGEVTVEFLEADITYGGQDDKLYMALILKSDWEAPHACRLFFRSQVEELGYPAGVSISELLSQKEWQNKIYNDYNLGQLVWNELIAATDGASHIYFTPTGIFYQWGIEYMPVSDDGTRICDKLNVSRLSSTKMLAQRNNAPVNLGNGDIVIYGGLEYENMSVAQMREYHDMGDDEVTDDDENWLAAYAAEQQMEDSVAIFVMAERGDKVENLQGAKKEVDEIEQLLFNAGKEYTSYKGFSGTEESFKRLSGRNISILHIATHGFSYPNGESSKHDWLEHPEPSKAMPTDPLCYSGLFFSGCNNKLRDPQDFPSDIDDGILTSQEITQLNLQDLQLTVLSACQTGTGMLREDGVFGVQRGFKKAGAHTLIMSLWSVNDEATQIMMTSFYSGLLSGLSRHDAFLKAQSAVRAVPKFSDPHYWAPFIMLDDI